MLYNVAQLLKEPAGAFRDYRLEDDVVFTDAPEWGPVRVRGTVRLLRTGPGILVTGALHTAIAEECSRCLQPLREALGCELEDEYFPMLDLTSGQPVEVPPDGFPIDAHHLLDLTEAVRQAIVVSQPIQPLCSAECRGLCPECGANRNEASGAGDPRWAALRALQP